jgi:hypothetical protein
MKKKNWMIPMVFVAMFMACEDSLMLNDQKSGQDSIRSGLKSVSMKERLKGFVLRGDADGSVGQRNHFDDPNTSSYEFGNYVDGLVVQVEWAHLQPEPSGEITSNNVIDQAIEAITEWNTNHASNPLAIKLRVFAGIYAPGWVADTTNGFMVYYKNDKQGMLPKYWWKNRYRPIWEDFQNKLAAKYDHLDIIGEVAVSGVMTHNAETMWRNLGDESRPDGRTNIEVMIENGLTLAKDEDALKWQVEAAANAWQQTPIALAMNMWKDYENNWTAKPSFVQELIDHCQIVCGDRIIIGNNSIGLSDVEKDDAYDSGDVLYYLREAFENKGMNIYVQTETVADTIHRAINYAEKNIGAEMAELPKLIAMDKFREDYLKKAAMQNARNELKYE